MKFQGTKQYVATEDLKIAVNAALTLEKPLLVKGEPGTGKTMLAVEVAQALGMRLVEWHVKSTTKASQGLYEYDAVSRLRDSQLGNEKVSDIANYIKKGKLWDAFTADERVVLWLMKLIKQTLNFPTIYFKNSIEWNFIVTSSIKQLKQSTVHLLSLHPTMKRIYPMHF